MQIFHQKISPMAVRLEHKEIIEVGHKAVESIIPLTGSDTPKIIVASRDRKVCVIALSSDQSPSKITESYEDNYSKRFTDVDYSTSGNKIIAVSANNEVSIWDRSTKECTKFKAHTRPITCVALNSENNKIVTGSEDHSFALWNTLGEKVFSFDKEVKNAHKNWINDLGFVPNSQDILITASEDGTVKIWDLTKNTLLKTFFDGQLVDYESKETKKPKDFDFDFAVKALAFSKDGSLLAYGGRNGRVYLLNHIENELLASIDVPDKVIALAYGESQPLIAISIPNKVLLWNIIEAKFIFEYEFAEKREVYARSLLFLGDELLVALEDSKVARIEVPRN